jgi:hypothetical protein
MKPTIAIATSLLLAVLGPASAQQSTPPSAKPHQIITNDIVVLPFCEDLQTQKLGPTSGIKFDDLTVSSNPQIGGVVIRINGKKHEDFSVQKGGRRIFHTGKLALLPPADRSGKITVAVPTVNDATYYYIILERPDGILQQSHLKLAPGAIYTWAIKSSNGETSFRLSNESHEIAALTAPTREVKGFGFAATVRWKSNEADMTITCQ